MNETKKSKKSLVILAIVLVAAIAVLAVVYALNKPKTTVGSKTITVSVVKAENESKEFEIHTDAEYLGQALLDEELIAGENGDYGLYITTVDGTVADEASQQWWCITKGGEDVYTGVDTTPIADGDRFELTLKTGW